MPGDDQYECIPVDKCRGTGSFTNNAVGYLDSLAGKCVEAGKCETDDHYTLDNSADIENNRKCVTADKCGSMIGDNVTTSPTYGQCIDIATCQAEAKKQCGEDEKWVEGNECVPDCNEHGTWDGEKCVCDAQHVPTDDGKSCELDCGEEADYDSEKDQCDCEAEGHVFVADGKKCVPDCDKHGEWDESKHTCICKDGFSALGDAERCEAHSCDEEGKIWRDEANTCIPDCDGHGTWDDDEKKCVCSTNYKLSSSSNEHCEPDCEGHGTWNTEDEYCDCVTDYDQSTDGYHCCPTGQDWDDDVGACVEDNPTGGQPHHRQVSSYGAGGYVNKQTHTCVAVTSEENGCGEDMVGNDVKDAGEELPEA